MNGPQPTRMVKPAGAVDFHTRRERGIAAYADIFAVPAAEVAAAFTGRVGPVFTEEALQSAGGAAWSHPGVDRAASPSSRRWPRKAYPVIASTLTCIWAGSTAWTRTR